MLKNASTVQAYIINPGTLAKAVSGDLTVTARYGGTRGNDIRVVIAQNVISGFDVMVYLGSELVELYKGVGTIGDLIKVAMNKYVKFEGTAEAALEAVAGINLSNANAGTVNNSMITAFLDRAEGVRWNTMVFPSETLELQTACISKIKALRSKIGKWVQAVIPNCTADYEGIINVTNAVILEDGSDQGKKLSVAQTCAWVAGATAAATKTESNTHLEYEGAIGIVGIKNNEAAEKAIKNGEFFFSMSNSGKVVVEVDINSLHTFSEEGRTKDYSKNKVLRVYDSFAEDLAIIFPPAKYNNDEDGWLVMEGLGRALLKRYFDEGAIKDVNYDSDFVVDKAKSNGDETYFNVGIKAVDASEKLYFSIATR